MHRGLIVLVVVSLAGCSGASDASPLTTVGSVASDPSASTSTSDSGEVAVTEVPTTSPTSSTTVAPTTTVDAEAAAIAAVEQAARDAYAAAHAAILDPSNPELRAEVERTYAAGPALDGAIEILDNLIVAGQVFRPHPELQPRVEIVGAVRFIDGDPTFADLIVCEFNPEAVVEVGAAPDGSDALVRDDVFTVELVQEFRLIDGRWFLTGGDSISTVVGDVGCE